MTRDPDPRARTDRRIAVLLSALTFALFWWVWGSSAPQPIGSDESAYLLQARIFASGQTVGADRPLEFFWQHHVFVEPMLAAKYPPGHSAVLALGSLAGAPWLMTLVAAALSSALVFLLTKRWSSRGTGVLAAALAMTSAVSLQFWPSYFSETTTATLFLIGWYALAEYWERGTIRWLLILAISVGLGAVTRPLTMLAFALPAAAVCIVRMRRSGTWLHLIPAALVTLTIVALGFAWNERLTGDWRRSPHAEYARRFIPSDRLGFGASPSAPGDSLPLELRQFDTMVRELHQQHTPARLPSIVMARARHLARDTWPYFGLPALFALFAFIALPLGVSLLVSATLLCVFVGYLLYAQIPSWTLYYLELQAPLAFLTAVGVREASARVAPLIQRVAKSQRDSSRFRVMLFSAISILLLLPALLALPSFRALHRDAQQPGEALARAVRLLPEGKALVFVRENLDQHPERSVVQNVVDLTAAPVWFAHDRGDRNSLLITNAPGRKAFLAIEKRTPTETQFEIEPFPPPRRPTGKRR